MRYEVVGHEVLAVEEHRTSRQTAIVRRHHTMFCHIRLDGPATVQVGQDVSLAVSLTRWDDGSLITDEDRTVEVLVDGQQVEQVTTVGGQAQVILRFADPGTYTIEARDPDGRAQAATLEVIVS